MQCVLSNQGESGPDYQDPQHPEKGTQRIWYMWWWQELQVEIHRWETVQSMITMHAQYIMLL